MTHTHADGAEEEGASSSAAASLPRDSEWRMEPPEQMEPGRIIKVLGIPMVIGRDDPGRMYWLTQGFVWLWYVNVLVVLLLALGGVRRFEVALAWAVIEAAVGLLTTTLLRQLYRRWFARPRRTSAQQAPVPWVGLACVVGGAYWAVVAWGVSGTFTPFTPVPQSAFPIVSHVVTGARGWIVRGTVDTLLLVFWSVGWFAAAMRRDVREARTRALAATAALERARFAALRYQVNPHFLFNALTALQGLIGEDAVRAERMVGELARYLRYTLLPGGAPGGGAIGDAASDALVPLADELSALRAYLAVEQVRFEERLVVDIAVDDAAGAVLVPPLLFQPLVENALRHGPQPGNSRATLELRISARLDQRTLVVEIANTGTLRYDAGSTAHSGTGDPRTRALGAERGSGVGLVNVRARLAHAFPDRHAFTLEARDGWVIARLVIMRGGQGPVA